MGVWACFSMRIFHDHLPCLKNNVWISDSRSVTYALLLFMELEIAWPIHSIYALHASKTISRTINNCKAISCIKIIIMELYWSPKLSFLFQDGSVEFSHICNHDLPHSFCVYQTLIPFILSPRISWQKGLQNSWQHPSIHVAKRKATKYKLKPRTFIFVSIWITWILPHT